MSTDAKKPGPPPASVPHKGMKIFSYPKIIFIMPTFVTAIICAIGMALLGDNTTDPKKAQAEAAAYATKGEPATVVETTERLPDGTTKTKAVVLVRRFNSLQNLLGVLFIVVFFANLLIMSTDFPRFTIIAMVLGAIALTFFLLWLNVKLDVIHALVEMLEKIFAVANYQFYALIATAIFINFGIIFVTRYLDYWEILPNEILHNHGPFSDLERYPTANLKFDKEIPDILEYALLRSGRLVLHVQNERKAIVLENVLWIDRKEEELKKLMSRMEVRVTTDQEAAEPI